MHRPQTVLSSVHWTKVFQANVGSREFGPERGRLTDAQRAAISRSLQEFQLGETGEGSHIMRHAQVHAVRDGDPEYLVALRLFIAEEIRHSRELKAFMDAHGIPTLQHTSAATLFRFARRLAGLELSIAVLVGAEIIAKVYYAALARATDSTVLEEICRRILRDEVDHVHFQTQRLAILRRRLGGFALSWRTTIYHLLFRATLLFVWCRHARVMHAAGYGFMRFYCHATAELRAAMISMNPRTYAWPGSPPTSCTFLSGRIRSIRCAAAGVRHVIRSQPNAWLHAAASAIVLLAGSTLRLKVADWCWLIVAIAAVWIAESLNTALELLCDVASPVYNPAIGKAKDVAAGAVLITASAAVAIGLCVILPRLLALL